MAAFTQAAAETSHPRVRRQGDIVLRVLKGLMIFMIAAVVLALLLVGYFFATARVSVVAYQVSGASAADRADEFARIKTDLAQNALIGTRFSAAPLTEASDYAFITYKLTVSNQCLVPIDMIEVQVVPDPGDIAQPADLAVRALDAKSQGAVSATILTAKDSNAVRELIVSYYVWGVSFSIRGTYG